MIINRPFTAAAAAAFDISATNATRTIATTIREANHAREKRRATRSIVIASRTMQTSINHISYLPPRAICESIRSSKAFPDYLTTIAAESPVAFLPAASLSAQNRLLFSPKSFAIVIIGSMTARNGCNTRMTDLANDEPDRLMVCCHKCGKVSAAIALVEQSGRLALEVSGFVGLCHFMEINQKPVDRELFETIRTLVHLDLVKLHGLDPDAFGFICRKCGCAYCIDCWENVHETFDEGFHDDTRGQCPEGHEQMLLD